MSRLTRDGTAEPISRDQILRHARGQGNIIFPVQLTTSRIGYLTWLIYTLLYVMTIHTYIHTYIHPWKSPTNLARSPLLVGPRRKKTDNGQRSAFPSEISRFAPCILVSRRGFSRSTPRRPTHIPFLERICCLLTGSSPLSRFPRRYASFGAMAVGTNRLTCGFNW